MPTREEMLEHANQNINAIIAKMLADEETLENDVRNLEHYSDVFLMLMDIDEKQKNWTSDVWKNEIHEIYEPLMELRRNILLIRERFWTTGEKARDYTKEQEPPADVKPKSTRFQKLNH